MVTYAPGRMALLLTGRWRTGGNTVGGVQEVMFGNCKVEMPVTCPSREAEETAYNTMWRLGQGSEMECEPRRPRGV